MARVPSRKMCATICRTAVPLRRSADGRKSGAADPRFKSIPIFRDPIQGRIIK